MKHIPKATLTKLCWVNNPFNIDDSLFFQSNSNSPEDDQVMKMIQRKTRRIGERFETGLLGKNGNIIPESKKWT